MTTADETGPRCHPKNVAFFDKAERTLRELFERAKATNELHFAMALMPEFRGLQDAGWSTAAEASRIFDDYINLLAKLEPRSTIRVRVGLSLYVQLSEASGFYEIPKKLLLTVEGNGNNMVPFQPLVRRHERTGKMIAPNANRVMADLIGHADSLGLAELAEVLREAFDADLRNAYAHADYIIWSDGLRLRRRNGGHPRVVPWDDVAMLFERGINLFPLIRDIVAEYIAFYKEPRVVRATMGGPEPAGPECDWVIYTDADGAFGLTSAPIDEVRQKLRGDRDPAEV